MIFFSAPSIYSFDVAAGRCLQRSQCLNYFKEQKLTQPESCTNSNHIHNESLICCSLNDFEKSRESLRIADKNSKSNLNLNYFNLENCLARDREFRHYSDRGL